MLYKGQILHNRYLIQEILSQGGSGTLYKARDQHTQRDCAVREKAQSAYAPLEFDPGINALAKLEHPHLARIVDYFIVAGQGQYLVTDFVEGDDLGLILTRNRGPLTCGQAVAWAEQVCDALTYLHSQNPPLIHGDIKPAKIRIDPAVDAVLVDFSLSRILKIPRQITQHFAAPELYGSSGPDARSDLYALGVTLY